MKLSDLCDLMSTVLHITTLFGAEDGFQEAYQERLNKIADAICEEKRLPRYLFPSFDEEMLLESEQTLAAIRELKEWLATQHSGFARFAS